MQGTESLVRDTLRHILSSLLIPTIITHPPCKTSILYISFITAIRRNENETFKPDHHNRINGPLNTSLKASNWGEIAAPSKELIFTELIITFFVHKGTKQMAFKTMPAVCEPQRGFAS